MPIRLVLAEDHYLVVRASAASSRRTPIDVVAVCGDLDSLLEAVDREGPDVVVTDIRMPPGHSDEGIQAAGRLRETNPAWASSSQPLRRPELRSGTAGHRQRRARLCAEGTRA